MELMAEKAAELGPLQLTSWLEEVHVLTQKFEV
jgi:hypothetical protein